MESPRQLAPAAGVDLRELPDPVPGGHPSALLSIFPVSAVTVGESL
jgi:hypothetical protein